MNEAEASYPLRLYVCTSCWLVQLQECMRAADIFTPEYIYYSSQSPANVSHAKDLVDIIAKDINFEKGCRFLEIGSNDGYLLQHLPDDVVAIGVDPAAGPAEVARARGITTHVDFFGKGFAEQIQKFDFICGINVFAHQPNINNFVSGLKTALKPNGVIIQEFPYVRSLFERCQFDTVYQEHYNYYSVTTLQSLFEAYDLTITNIDYIETHGGSLRVYVQHSESYMPVQNIVPHMLKEEVELGMNTVGYYSELQEQVDQVKLDLLRYMIDIRATGRNVIAYGAAAKGNTLLNYCGIKPDIISAVVDKSIYKKGTFLPGSHIPVVDEAIIKRLKPEYILILPWNLDKEIMRQLDYIREWNGHFIIPIPEVRIR